MDLCCWTHRASGSGSDCMSERNLSAGNSESCLSRPGQSCSLSPRHSKLFLLQPSVIPSGGGWRWSWWSCWSWWPSLAPGSGQVCWRKADESSLQDVQPACPTVLSVLDCPVSSGTSSSSPPSPPSAGGALSLSDPFHLHLVSVLFSLFWWTFRPASCLGGTRPVDSTGQRWDFLLEWGLTSTPGRGEKVEVTV